MKDVDIYRAIVTLPYDEFERLMRARASLLPVEEEREIIEESDLQRKGTTR